MKMFKVIMIRDHRYYQHLLAGCTTHPFLFFYFVFFVLILCNERIM